MDITGESMSPIWCVLKVLLSPEPQKQGSASRPSPLCSRRTEQTTHPAGLCVWKGPLTPSPMKTWTQGSNCRSGPTAKGISALTNSATQDQGLGFPVWGVQYLNANEAAPGHRKQTYGYQRGKWGGTRWREFGISRYKLLYIK